MFMNHLDFHFSEIHFTHLSLKLFVFLGTVVKAPNGPGSVPFFIPTQGPPGQQPVLPGTLAYLPQSPLLLEIKPPSCKEAERHIRL